jgi:NAD-dependent SIR2 family protein deacetylase
LTGAGCSTNSEIPDYGDANGDWKRMPPVRFPPFVADEMTSRCYWKDGGLAAVRLAKPNNAHHALASYDQFYKKLP